MRGSSHAHGNSFANGPDDSNPVDIRQAAVSIWTFLEPPLVF